jgi:lysophospholipase-3
MHMEALMVRNPLRAVVLLSAVVVMLALSSCCASSAVGGQLLHPVILIPGSGGNQLEARLTDDYRPSSLTCRVWPPVRGRGGWFRLWFDPSVLLAPLTRCFAERMMLYYDRDANDYRNAPGVETRVSEFGSTSTLRYLDPTLKYAPHQFTKFFLSVHDNVQVLQ